MELVKVRVSDVLFEQIATNRYRVFVDNKLVNDTSNAAEAKIWFCGEVERKLNKYLSEKLRDQGIDPMTGKIGAIKVKQ